MGKNNCNGSSGGNIRATSYDCSVSISSIVGGILIVV